MSREQQNNNYDLKKKIIILIIMKKTNSSTDIVCNIKPSYNAGQINRKCLNYVTLKSCLCQIFEKDKQVNRHLKN